MRSHGWILIFRIAFTISGQFFETTTNFDLSRRPSMAPPLSYAVQDICAVDIISTSTSLLCHILRQVTTLVGEVWKGSATWPRALMARLRASFMLEW